MKLALGMGCSSEAGGAKLFHGLTFTLVFQGAGSAGKTFPNRIKTLLIYLCEAEHGLFWTVYSDMRIWQDMLAILPFRHWNSGLTSLKSREASLLTSVGLNQGCNVT